jgi:hypothetical protein
LIFCPGPFQKYHFEDMFSGLLRILYCCLFMAVPAASFKKSRQGNRKNNNNYFNSNLFIFFQEDRFLFSSDFINFAGMSCYFMHMNTGSLYYISVYNFFVFKWIKTGQQRAFVLAGTMPANRYQKKHPLSRKLFIYNFLANDY